MVTCGREGRWRPGVCRNVVTCRGKFPSAAGPEPVRAGAQRKEEPGGGGAGERRGRAVLSTLVLAFEASFCLSRALPPPGKRKGGRKEQEKEIKEKRGGKKQLAVRHPSREWKKKFSGAAGPGLSQPLPRRSRQTSGAGAQGGGGGAGAGDAGPRRSPPALRARRAPLLPPSAARPAALAASPVSARRAGAPGRSPRPPGRGARRGRQTPWIPDSSRRPNRPPRAKGSRPRSPPRGRAHRPGPGSRHPQGPRRRRRPPRPDTRSCTSEGTRRPTWRRFSTPS